MRFRFGIWGLGFRGLGLGLRVGGSGLGVGRFTIMFLRVSDQLPVVSSTSPETPVLRNIAHGSWEEEACLPKLRSQIVA